MRVECQDAPLALWNLADASKQKNEEIHSTFTTNL